MAFLKEGLARKSTKKCFGLILPIDTGWLMGDLNYLKASTSFTEIRLAANVIGKKFSKNAVFFSA